MKLLVDGMQDGYLWAIKSTRGVVIERGCARNLLEIRDVQMARGRPQVLIDRAYRREEVNQACARFGWVPVKGLDAAIWKTREKTSEQCAAEEIEAAVAGDEYLHWATGGAKQFAKGGQ